METDLRMLPAEFLGILYSALCHVTQKGLVGILAGSAGNLKDDRRLCLGSSLDDSLELLHVVEIEGRDGIAACNSLGKHLSSVYKAKFFV